MTLKTTKEQRAKWVRWAQSKCRIMLELSDIEDLCHDADRARELEKELETERMRLAGCGVAAIGYFTECADEYKSASLDDVLRLYQEAADLRVKLNGAYEKAAQELEKAFDEADTLNLLHGAARVRALKNDL